MAATEADAHAHYLRALQIIDDVIFPRLDRPVPQTDRLGQRSGYRAFAPCHDDHAGRSLSISPGTTKPVVWKCFACSDSLGTDEAQRHTREALIHKSGVPMSALKWSAAETADFAEKVTGLYDFSIRGAAFQLWTRAYLESYDRLPRGDELLALAERAGVGKSAAFAALAEHRAGRAPATDNEYLPRQKRACQIGEVVAGQLAS